MDIAKEIYENGFRYEVFYDYHDCIDEIDFEDDADKQSLIDNLDSGELSVFGVIKYRKCECCESWKQVDCIGGMIEETWEDCFKTYQNNYED
jgi:hypothetical protein